MHNPHRYPLVPSLFLCAALALPATHAAAQGAKGAKGIAGTWSLVSNVTTDASGKKEPTYGEKPMGQVTFTPEGRYTLIISRPDLPKVAANNRLKATAEENKAITGGMLAHYGKYKVDPDGKSFTLSIESSSFPNWNGTQQKRLFSVSGNELKWTTPQSSGGGSSDLVWKRAS
ncbi:MAG: lipocalin-like domain-containing protein [Usitatibacter sp.]